MRRTATHASHFRIAHNRSHPRGKQNTLFYVGSGNLDAAPFQAISQFKVVTTALVTVVLFKRCIQPLQWLSIVSLMGGLMLVVLSNLKEGPPKVDTNPILGYSATLGICGLSAVAGVYLECVHAPPSSLPYAGLRGRCIYSRVVLTPPPRSAPLSLSSR